jgi:hypothetical protein
VRAQLVLFDLPAMAANLNVKQFNGYFGCPDCKMRGVLRGREVFYPHSDVPCERKNSSDYATFSIGNYSRNACFGILGSTPLSRILSLPTQCPKDYMHLVASGHFKWLLQTWQSMFTRDAFDEGTRFVNRVNMPRCFGYQFLPLNACSSWKAKHYRDFLLYIAPVFAVLFIPDVYVEHFMNYFVYIRNLHFFDSPTELDQLETIFSQYARQIENLYGYRSSLCSLHMHVHLVRQVINHGALSMTSCFSRESYLGSAIKICHGSRQVLQQFVDWYDIDQAIRSPCSFTIEDIFTRELIFDQNYVDRAHLEQMQTAFKTCTIARSMQVSQNLNEIANVRFKRGFSIFHSSVYSRGGRSKSSFVSVSYAHCSFDEHAFCFAELLFFFSFERKNYAFAKIFPCNRRSLSKGLSLSGNVRRCLENTFRFFKSDVFEFSILSVCAIVNLAIRLPWPEDESLFCFTTISLQSEHE